MGNVVVDSSVVIKWFVDEPLSVEAQRILVAYQAGNLTLLAPDLLIAEVGNVIWKKHRLHGLSQDDAKALLTTVCALPIILVPTPALIDDALAIAMTCERTVYDALYIALSERERCPYVTADEKLVNAVQKIFPNTVWIARWPT